MPCNAQFETKLRKCIRMGINHIQNFYLGRCIVGYTVANHVLRLRSRVNVKLNFRPYIRRYTSQNENFEYSYPLNKSRVTALERTTNKTIGEGGLNIFYRYIFALTYASLHINNRSNKPTKKYDGTKKGSFL